MVKEYAVCSRLAAVLAVLRQERKKLAVSVWAAVVVLARKLVTRVGSRVSVGSLYLSIVVMGKVEWWVVEEGGGKVRLRSVSREM